MERIFDLGILLFLFVFTAVAFVLGLIVGGIKRDDTGVILKRGGEAAILALLGGFIAHLFISVLLATGNDSPLATCRRPLSPRSWGRDRG